MRTIDLTLALAWTIMAGARPVDIGQAHAVASRFMAGKTLSSMTVAHTHQSPAASCVPYYVFNAQNRQGYVIVAGDDRVPAILGYSSAGSIDPDEMPPAMRQWLEGYQAQIEALGDEEVCDVPLHLSGRAAIAPLVPARWNQGAPYNILLPMVSGKHASTGCVATAMAQIMYTHRWPEQPTVTIPSYTTSTNAIFMPSLPPTTFGWDDMKDIYYTDDTTSVNATAVATLMKYCAQSVKMNFLASSSGSLTSRIPGALATYFGYKPSACYVARENYSTEEWEEMLYDELAAGRPVVYGGNKKSGGHAFVCDGYDGNGMFHINWGWGSQSDGYFLLNVLNPSSQGIGSVSGAYGYIYGQGMGIGLEPGTDGDAATTLTYRDLTVNSSSLTRTSSAYYFSVTVSGKYHNYTSQTGDFNLGWGLYKDGELVTRLYSSYTKGMAPAASISTNSRTLSFGAGITSGTYRIVPICAVYNSGNWMPYLGADVNYIEVTLAEKRCTLVGHGTAGTPNYTVNNVKFAGTLHPGKAVNVTANLTNKGITRGDRVYLFVDGEFTSAGMADMLPGEAGDVVFRFVPTETGSKRITLSLNDDGTSPMATRTLVITAMPTATLQVSAQVLNITDSVGRVVTSNRYGVLATITNTGTTTYDEDFAFRCYRVTYGNYGTSIQTQSRPLLLAPGETTTMTFECDNVMNDFKYFARLYYYSEGELIQARGTGIYTLQFPAEVYEQGDVNHDHTVDVTDVNLIVNQILGKGSESADMELADMDDNGIIDVTDINLVVNIILGKE